MFDYRSSLDKIKLSHTVKFREAPNDPTKRCTFEYICMQMMFFNGYVEDGYDIPDEKCYNKYAHHRVFYRKNDDGTICRDGGLYVAYHYVDRGYHINDRIVLMEFNPNKCLDMYISFCAYFDIKTTTIHKFDVAFDFPNLRRSLVGYNTRCDVMTYGTQDNNTLYIAPKTKESGRIKVYQKDVERGDTEKRLRVEITLRNDYDAKAMVDRLSTLHYHHRSEFEVSSDPWLYLLLQAPPWERDNALSLMSINTRGKYKKMLSEAESFVPLFEITPEQFQKVVNDLLAFYRETDRA